MDAANEIANADPTPSKISNGEDTPMQDVETPQIPTEQISDSDSDSNSDDSEEEPPTEWLATSRQKRSTAGNRLNVLLQQAHTEEDPEDELALLFAEDENAHEDGGFSDHAAHDSDVQMDSSSDSENSGAEDEMEGEKALQKQEKEAQKKKRKLNDRIPIFKKRVKIDPTAVSKQTPPRPKKKSERASWIPAVEDLPTRASRRETTMHSKEMLHAQMVDRELKRLKVVRNMEKAQAAKDAKKKPAMTQADRLAEAARIEKQNTRSLSRWEEAELLREEEQKARLAALKNRKLDGPVITWWSGMAEWFGGRLKQVGKNLTIEEPKEKAASKKRKASEMEEGKETAGEVAVVDGKGTAPDDSTKSTTKETPQIETPQNETLSEVPPELQPSKSEAPPPSTENKSPPPQTAEEKKSSPPPEEELPPPPIVPLQQPLPPRSSVLAPPPGLPTQAPHPPPNFHHHHSQNLPPYVLAPPALDGSAPLPGLGFGYNFQAPAPRSGQGQFAPPYIPQTHASPQPPTTKLPQNPTPSPQPPPFGFPLGQHHYHHHSQTPPPPPHFQSQPPSQIQSQNPSQIQSQSQPNLNFFHPPQPLVQEVKEDAPPILEHATKNYLILQNFDDTAIKDKNVQMEVIFGRKFQKLPNLRTKTTHPLCPLTSLPARYRDPTTGLPYANAFAFSELKKLQRGEYKWSALVGGYVGLGVGVEDGVAARGVPVRFRDPNAVREDVGGAGTEGDGKGSISLGRVLRDGAIAGGNGNSTPSGVLPVSEGQVGQAAAP